MATTETASTPENNLTEPSTSPLINEDELNEEEEELIEDYNEELEKLGNHPEKVQINTLSMIAGDYAQDSRSSLLIYNCIRTRLISEDTPNDYKLPLVYLVDSILKNVGKEFLSISQNDVKNWIPAVYKSLSKIDPTLPSKLKRVINTWKDYNVFNKSNNNENKNSAAAAVKEMLACFDAIDQSHSQTSQNAQQAAQKLMKDLSPTLKNKMQVVFDDMNSDVDELEKISLERLATIDQELFLKIKQVAEMDIAEGGTGGDDGKDNNTSSSSMSKNNHSSNSSSRSSATSKGRGKNSSSSSSSESIFSNLIHPKVLQRTKNWQNIGFQYQDESRLLVKTLQHNVMDYTKKAATDEYTTKNDEESKLNNDNDMIVEPGLVAAATAAANQISLMLQSLQDQDAKNNTNSNSLLFSTQSTSTQGGGGSSAGVVGVGGVPVSSSIMSTQLFSSMVDKSLFTTSKIMQLPHHKWVVGRLYEQGLPFVSTSDGRRFSTQLGLSQHLDALFKKAQIEKTMEKNEERGWHIDYREWCGEQNYLKVGVSSSLGQNNNMMDVDATNANNNNNSSMDSSTLDGQNNKDTVPADEDRSRCVICGNTFVMFFDQEEGQHMYKHCREIELLSDNDAALEPSEHVLVHTRCLQGLGFPDKLLREQVLQL